MKSIIELNNKKISSTILESIGRTFNSLYTPLLGDSKIWRIVESQMPEDIYNLVKHLKATTLGHKVINDLIMNYYPNERVIKYHIIKECLYKKDEVTFFEMNVDSSRVDLCRVNGKSVAYEIKTELDNTNRIEKQIYDYLKVFEYVNIITHRNHTEKIKEIIPQICGIKEYQFRKGKCTFKTIQKAVKNNNIDSKAQIRNLSSEDLRVVLREYGYKCLSSSRVEREKIIFESIGERKINELFKLAVKIRFSKQWTFLCNNFDKIMPIDIQSFFHSPINPDSIYYKSSSNV
ncbi:MAG: sce7726 family protein [Clostridia bacterium]|nr:sce7726 family protein [Clostridia bacterium]